MTTYQVSTDEYPKASFLDLHEALIKARTLLRSKAFAATFCTVYVNRIEDGQVAETIFSEDYN